MQTITWPWAIVLCKYNDEPREPQSPAFYKDLFTKNGKSSICEYWSDVTSGILDLSGSKVFGWITMAHVTSELRALHFPQDRAKLFQWGLDAAAAAGIDLSSFRSIIILQNDGVDHGAVGINQVEINGYSLPVNFGP